ncbi:MAG: hypothetical protein KDJ16_07885 [Hyphomicrobiales bacterium]|nr:hypothetical protein [Hyphomicrobiales bacterium]
MVGIRITLILVSMLCLALPAAAETTQPMPKPANSPIAADEKPLDTHPEPAPKPAKSAATETTPTGSPSADGPDVPARAPETTVPGPGSAEPAAETVDPAAPAATIAPPATNPPLPVPRPIAHLFETGPFQIFIRIFKQESALELWYSRGGEYKLARTYPICAWSGSLGPKLREGDYQSPEGFYVVNRSQLKPNSDYHRAFNVGFPNAFDKAQNRTGSFLMVHGACASVGCYAMTDPAIEEIYDIVEKALIDGQPGIPVHIFPFRMTEETLKEHYGTEWISFWRNLKEGYDIFEKTRIPPQASACGTRYGFGDPKSWCKPITGWQTAQSTVKRSTFTGTIRRSNDR